MAAFEYSTLNPLPATEWDTPEMIKARNACNQEIEAIQQERQQIVSSLQALTRSDIASLDFDEIEAKRNKFQRDRLCLMQRELKLRKLQLNAYFTLEKETAKAVGKEWEQDLVETEAKIIKNLEAMGYLTCGKQPGFGTWVPDMIHRHPERRDIVRKVEASQQCTRNFDNARQNDEIVTQIQATLSKALTSLVG